MNCNEARRWLSPYLDSELCATKTYEVSEHLRTCAACRVRFEAERGAEGLIRERMTTDGMPSAMWARISASVHRPAWIHRIGLLRGAAIAAAMLIVAAVAFYALRPKSADGDRPWVVRELAVLAPDGGTFIDDDASVAEDDVFRSVLGVDIPRDALAGMGGHHPIELVATRARKDSAGRPFVEVRLRCCGQAVLLLMARDGNVLPEAFDGAPIDTLPSWQPDGVHVNVRRFDGIVAVAASYHTVEPVLGHLRVRAT